MKLARPSPPPGATQSAAYFTFGTLKGHDVVLRKVFILSLTFTSTVPTTLLEARKVAGSATYKQSETV